MEDLRAVQGLILSGGASRRMGQAKGLLRVREHNLLTLAVQSFQPYCSSVTVVTGAHAQQLIDAVDAPVQWIHARGWRHGMRASLRAGIRGMPQGHILLTHVDRPGVLAQTIEDLLEGSRTRPRIPIYRGQPGHPVFLPSWLRARLCEKDDVPLRDILRPLRPELVPTKDPAVIRNLNDRRDWVRFLAHAQK